MISRAIKCIGVELISVLLRPFGETYYFLAHLDEIILNNLEALNLKIHLFPSFHIFT